MTGIYTELFFISCGSWYGMGVSVVFLHTVAIYCVLELSCFILLIVATLKINPYWKKLKALIDQEQ